MVTWFATNDNVIFAVGSEDNDCLNCIPNFKITKGKKKEKKKKKHKKM